MEKDRKRARLVNISIQKALHILGVIRSLPSGGLVFSQIEQILLDLENEQGTIEQTYSQLSYMLFDVLMSQLPADSPLQIQLGLLQARIQPPLLPGDIASLIEDAGPVLQHFLQKDSVTNTYIHLDKQEPDSGSNGPVPEILPRHETVSPQQQSHVDPSFEITTASSTSLEMPGAEGHGVSELRQSLSHKIKEAVLQNQDSDVMLDLIMGELQHSDQMQNIDELKQQLLHQVRRLRSDSRKMLGVLEGADQYLGNIEGGYQLLDEELNRARMLSLTDDLTELPNRRAFLCKLENELGRVRRHNQPLSLAIIDLDKFKDVNDQHGHAVGDEVLRCYANDVFSVFRQYDMVARFGGEEFAVILPNTDMEGALCALDKLRDKVGRIVCEVNNQSIPIPSFSAGLALYNEGEPLGNYIERADQAMYRAKALGRGRVECDGV